jgi:hypothetical protein
MESKTGSEFRLGDIVSIEDRPNGFYFGVLAAATGDVVQQAAGEQGRLTEKFGDVFGATMNGNVLHANEELRLGLDVQSKYRSCRIRSRRILPHPGKSSLCLVLAA